MKRQELESLKRQAWWAASLQLAACRAGAKELERIMAGAARAARSTASFMSRITASELTPD